MRACYADKDMVNDDSLFHYFLPEILALAKADSPAFVELSSNRRFVILYSSPRLIVQNVRRRQDRGIYRTGVSSSTDEALMRRAENYNSNLRSFEDVCGKWGFPALAVIYENNADVDAEVLQFIIGPKAVGPNQAE